MAWWGTDVPAERAALAVNDLVEACDGVERLKSFLMQLGGHGAPWAEGVADGVYVGQAIERDVGAGRCRRESRAWRSRPTVRGRSRRRARARAGTSDRIIWPAMGIPWWPAS
jgi:hypothetical protein